jgi:8-oxo-dGTP pyrophosphatase MutT (NUDIX family)
MYFQVSIKAIVKNGSKILLLETPDGYYDFPGGRIDETEKDLELHEVLKREIQEELGKNIKFIINDVAFASKRRFTEKNKDNRLIAIYYEVEYLSGEIKLSDEHSKYSWINPSSILEEPDKFMSKDEYNQYNKYLSKI